MVVIFTFIFKIKPSMTQHHFEVRLNIGRGLSSKIFLNEENKGGQRLPLFKVMHARLFQSFGIHFELGLRYTGSGYHGVSWSSGSPFRSTWSSTSSSMFSLGLWFRENTPRFRRPLWARFNGRVCG